MTFDHYKAPETWAELYRLKQQMQVDMLSAAARKHRTIKEAGKSIGMGRTQFSNACYRFGVDPKTGEPL